MLFLFGSISGILFLGGALFQRCVFNPPKKWGGEDESHFDLSIGQMSG